MLGAWILHADYQRFMVARVNALFKRNPKAIEYYESVILKMYYLNLDCVKDDFAPLFSTTVRSFNQQTALFRSLILMLHFKYADIDRWAAYAADTPMICALAGADIGSFPDASTYRDFISRLWMVDKPNRGKKVKSKPKGNHSKEKLPVKHPRIVAYLVERSLSGTVFQAIPERLLQSIFMKTALMPSDNLGLIGDTDYVIVSGDGTRILSHAAPYGHKTCKCEARCNCPRSFADSSAEWGCDSYHEQWFYGYSAYLLSVHNKMLKTDLPNIYEICRSQSARQRFPCNHSCPCPVHVQGYIAL